VFDVYDPRRTRMQHRNAPLTPSERRHQVALVEEEGFALEAKSTAHTWVSRWREAGEEQTKSQLPARPLLTSTP
jgi:transposase